MRKDFALCFNDNYVPYACVTIKSIIDHMKKDDDINIHVLSDYLSLGSRNTLDKLCKSSNCSINVYIVEDTTMFAGLDMSWSIYTWFRLLLPDYLDESVKKVLYIDCDIIVNDTLDELFEMDMKSYAIAGCLDIESYNPRTFSRLQYESKLGYICAGCLLMNLDVWRKELLASEMIKFASEHPERIAFPDQCAINYICRDKKYILPPPIRRSSTFFHPERFYTRKHFLYAGNC